MIDLVSKRFLYIILSFAIIIPGLLAIFAGGLKPGIDFTGGTRWEVQPVQQFATDTERFKQVLSEAGYDDAQVKGAQLGEGATVTNTIVMVLPGNLQEEGRREEKAAVEKSLIDAGLVVGETFTETVNITPSGPITLTNPVTGTTTVTATTGTATVGITGTAAAGAAVTATGTTTDTAGAGITEPTAPQTETRVYQRIRQSDVIDFRSVGAAVGAELINRSIIAIVAASSVILLYLTLVFRRVPNSFRYGMCAIFALVHDVLVVLGIFAILGLLFGVEIDALFITAMMTVIGFSVHDTIVVFDRVRENIMKRRFERFEDVVNYSLVQTLARSINTSVTVVLTLFALYLFGGSSIRNFVLALLIGIISGTYSSLFNASMLLVIWENREWGRLFGRGSNPPPAPVTRAGAR